MSNTLRRLVLLFGCVALVLAADNVTTKRGKPGMVDLGHGAKALLWLEPTDISSRNLLYGSGGKDHQPQGPFTFIEEDMEGTNPKFDIRDQSGVKWKVKLGAEARPEVVASRFMWAAGYYTNDDYFIEELRVQDLPRQLHRGQNFVGADGAIHGARLKRSMKGEEKTGAWEWGSNPFKNTREFNGLRVLMALMNNWDLKDSNNAIYQGKDKKGPESLEQIYMVSDLGATFGKTGFTMSHEASRGNLESYKDSKFITGRTRDQVDFAAPSRPTLVETFNVPVFVKRIDMRWIGRDIPIADAKWMGQLLGRLSPDQIRDAFRAAGYSSQDASEFAAVVQGRIAELNAL